MSLAFEPLAAALGAEVSGVDLAGPLEAATRKELDAPPKGSILRAVAVPATEALCVGAGCTRNSVGVRRDESDALSFRRMERVTPIGDVPAA